MKKILITGKNSYIGSSFEKWVSDVRFEKSYQVDTLDMQEERWRGWDFSGYDVVLHLAGIVHQKETSDNRDLYERVNHLLAVEVYEKCLKSGVGQFIFMSSGAVFGQNDRNHPDIRIGKTKQFHPQTEYGKSKRRAELDMLRLAREQKEDKKSVTKLAIIRPPMIYGAGAKGNYTLLSKVSRVMPIFPDIKNQRSILHISNLCECIRLIIDKEDAGCFHPQNREFVKISDLVREIRTAHKKTIYLTKCFNPLLKYFQRYSDVINKVFGSYIYEKEISGFYNWEYCQVPFQESIREAEKTPVC